MKYQDKPEKNKKVKNRSAGLSTCLAAPTGGLSLGKTAMSGPKAGAWGPGVPASGGSHADTGIHYQKFLGVDHMKCSCWRGAGQSRQVHPLPPGTDRAQLCETGEDLLCVPSFQADTAFTRYCDHTGYHIWKGMFL